MMSKLKTATDGMLLALLLIAFGWLMISIALGFWLGPAISFFVFGLPIFLLGLLGYYIEYKNL